MVKTGTSIILVIAFLLCQCKLLTADVFADHDSILLTLENASFVPLSNVHGNQVTMSVKYQVNDESLEGEKINGIMKLYSTNGSLIHSSSFPDGFTAKKKGGTEDFKTTIRDPAIQSLTANVTFTVCQMSSQQIFSLKLSVPVATPDLDDSIVG